MSTYASRKGYVAEHDVELVLLSRGFDVHRPRAGSQHDVGDLVGVPGVVISVKNHSEPRLSTWLIGVDRMQREVEAPIGVVWHKRKQYGSPLDWYVTMSGRSFVAVLDRLVTV